MEVLSALPADFDRAESPVPDRPEACQHHAQTGIHTVMKGIKYQFVQNVDDTRYLYTAFNQDGSLCGFVNPPVRNYAMGIWVDSVTGESGDLINYEAWDQSMRIIADMADCRKPAVNYPKGYR